MSNRILEFIKEHPYGVAAGVVGTYVIYSFLSAGASGTSATTANASDSALTADEINAGNQLQVAQLSAQQQTNQVNASAQVANNQTAAQLSAVQIAANSSDNQASISAQTAQITAQLEAQTQATVSTLSAQVANTTTAAQVAVDANNNQTEFNIAALPYDLAAMEFQPNATTNAQISAINTNLAAVINNVDNFALVAGYNLQNGAPSGAGDLGFMGTNPNPVSQADFNNVLSSLQSQENPS